MLKVFISHASEDKDSIARPVANYLNRLGLDVWFDEYTLTMGDNLRRSIEDGLARCDYGVVVLSPSFFLKEWPQKELDGLATRELNGVKVILPVWHEVNRETVGKYSLFLADRLAARSDMGVASVVNEISRAILKQHPEIEPKLHAAIEQLKVTQFGDGDGGISDEFIEGRASVMSAIEFIEQLYKRNGKRSADFWTTTIPPIDGLIGGFAPRQVALFVADGRDLLTSLGIQVAVRNSLESRPVFYISSSRSVREVTMRAISLHSNVSLARCYDAFLSRDDVAAITRTAAIVAKSPFHIRDAPMSSVEDLIKIVRGRAQDSENGTLCIVDSLNRFSNAQSEYSREIFELARWINLFKESARESGLTYLLLWRGEPKLSHQFVESTEAHIVASMWQPYYEDYDGSYINLSIARSEYGVFDCALAWDPRTYSLNEFKSPAEEVSGNDEYLDDSDLPVAPPDDDSNFHEEG